MLELELVGDPAGADAAVLEGAQLQAPGATGEVDRRHASAGLRRLLDDEHVKSLAGQVARACEPVVTGADHDHVGGRAH